ncbi:hypothetical protein P3X83_28950 [Spongiactinospora sp. TRM90649]|nr:hypothetical protein [Spongiactinospora sp. TRM90649]
MLAPVGLAAATEKSILGVRSGASFGLEVKKLRVGLYGTSASGAPGDVHLCLADFTANPPGTNSVSIQARQVYGRTIASGITAGVNWSNEPTDLTVLDSWALSPNGSTVIYDLPLGDSPDCAPSAGWVLRATFPAAVSISASMWVERI